MMQKGGRIDEKQHIVSKVLNATAQGLLTVYKNAMPPLIEHTAAEFHNAQSQDLLCCQLALSLGALGSDNSYNGNGS